VGFAILPCIFLYFQSVASTVSLLRFHRYQSRREYRRTCETAGKSGKQIQSCVIATFRIAESMGFKGEFRQWEDLLRVGD
jgi:hypothetical protein